MDVCPADLNDQCDGQNQNMEKLKLQHLGLSIIMLILVPFFPLNHSIIILETSTVFMPVLYGSLVSMLSAVPR